MTGTDTHRFGGLLAHADPRTAWLLLGAHIVVGLLAATWLRRGERALAQLLRAVATTTFRPLLLAAAALRVRPVPRTKPPGAAGPPYGRRSRRDPRALPGTAWTAVLGRFRLKPEEH